MPQTVLLGGKVSLKFGREEALVGGGAVALDDLLKDVTRATRPSIRPSSRHAVFVLELVLACGFAKGILRPKNRIMGYVRKAAKSDKATGDRSTHERRPFVVG